LKSIAGLILLFMTAGCAIRVPPPVEVPRQPGVHSPEVVRFVVHPRVIKRGETAMLHWDARNANEVLLEKAADPYASRPADFHAVGKFASSGTLEVRPKVTTIYVVSCGDELIGCSSASVRVQVR
jgi:hypothetical protein